MTEYTIGIVTARDPCSEFDLPPCLLNVSNHTAQQTEDTSVHNQHPSHRLCTHCFFFCKSHFMRADHR